jgi:Domain of unknown function (DUF4272)
MVPPAPVRAARRAVILYTLMMRFTVETNPNHPRTKEWLEVLPRWLDRLDVRSEVEPRDVEILTTPVGELDQAQQADAHWSGEAAAVLGWALRRVAAPADFDPVDPNQVFRALGFDPAGMVQGAGDLSAGASLRPQHELLAYYAKVRTVQCCLRSRGLSAAYATPSLQQIVRQQLDNLGVREAEFSAAQESVARLSEEQYRQLLGNYVVRAHAAGWVVGERERYWGGGEETGNEE